MALRDQIRRVVGSRAGSDVAKTKGSRALKGNVSFDVQKKGDANYLVVNVGKAKFRIPMAGVKKTPKKFFKDYIGMKPDYDSGWINVTNDTEYAFKHNLETKMLLQQWYFRDDSDNIFDVSSESLHEIINSPTDKDTGISIFMESDFQISVGTGAHFVFAHFGTDADAGYVELADGHLRCFLWKIGKHEG